VSYLIHNFNLYNLNTSYRSRKLQFLINNFKILLFFKINVNKQHARDSQFLLIQSFRLIYTFSYFFEIQNQLTSAIKSRNYVYSGYTNKLTTGVIGFFLISIINYIRIPAFRRATPILTYEYVWVYNTYFQVYTIYNTPLKTSFYGNTFFFLSLFIVSF